MVFSHKTHRKEKGLGNRKNVEHLSSPWAAAATSLYSLSLRRESERGDTQQGGGGGDGAKSVEWILFDHLEGAE